MSTKTFRLVLASLLVLGILALATLWSVHAQELAPRPTGESNPDSIPDENATYSLLTSLAPHGPGDSEVARSRAYALHLFGSCETCSPSSPSSVDVDSLVNTAANYVANLTNANKKDTISAFSQDLSQLVPPDQLQSALLGIKKTTSSAKLHPQGVRPRYYSSDEICSGDETAFIYTDTYIGSQQWDGSVPLYFDAQIQANDSCMPVYVTLDCEGPYGGICWQNSGTGAGYAYSGYVIYLRGYEPQGRYFAQAWGGVDGSQLQAGGGTFMFAPASNSINVAFGSQYYALSATAPDRSVALYHACDSIICQYLDQVTPRTFRDWQGYFPQGALIQVMHITTGFVYHSSWCFAMWAYQGPGDCSLRSPNPLRS